MLTCPMVTKRQAGMSLVELMVGVAVSLVILSGSLVFFASFMKSNRDLLLGTQLNQELRSAADLVARDLRRSGYWQNAIDGVWYSGTPQVLANPHSQIEVNAGISYSYARDGDNALNTNERTGFRLSNGTLQMLRNGAWVEMTNPDTTRVTGFSITPTVRTVPISCVNACPDGGQACWPKLVVREYTLFIRAEARSDASVKRQLSESVRVRNDLLAIPLLAGANPQICPVT